MNYSQTVASFPTLNELCFEAERAQRQALLDLLRKVAVGEGLKLDELVEKYLRVEDSALPVAVPTVRKCSARTTKKAQCTRAACAHSDYCKAHQKKIDEA